MAQETFIRQRCKLCRKDTTHILGDDSLETCLRCGYEKNKQLEIGFNTEEKERENDERQQQQQTGAM